MKHYKCEYCGNNLVLNSRGGCSACGAPNELKSNICSCGLLLDETVIITWKQTETLCHSCYKTFESSITGRYIGDKYYGNGEITHVFKTEDRKCPHCGVIFSAHEFYHRLTGDVDDDKLVKTAKEARVSGMEAAGTVWGSLQEGGVKPIDFKDYVFQGGYDK